MTESTFMHLRSTKREESNPMTFHEAAHLDGDGYVQRCNGASG
ncbi:hypothetical protein OH492_12095 [Vibrio chagasii]|nr:hypothetical protein [Vibrio chagasii]